ncbi:MAG: ATP-binding cassette domain-containing protein [Actinomycetota bacterium]|nr:ATP-binding cassette domain-containing protein [Actinomycetota bacterium]
MGDLLVHGSGLSRTFGSGSAPVSALREATFEVHPGDHIAVVGPSGSGKSTLLHLIAALDRPTTGTIEWPALGPASSLRPGLVSFSFQGPSLLPPLTVLENVALPLLLAGVAEEDALGQAAAMIERLDLAAVASKLPEELSGGQAQRASVARALVGRPRIILADEPTGQQDRGTGQRVVDEMLGRAGALGAALLVATHDRTVAERLPLRWSLQDGQLDTGVVARSR